jgi:lactate racemase
LASPSGGAELDRWQAQVLGRFLARAEVHLHCDGLDRASVEDALLRPAPDLDGAVAAALERLGPGATVAVLPEGPLTVAGVAGR